MPPAARISDFPARGAIAQLGERYNGIVEVAGSIPAGSTTSLARNTSPSSRGPGHYPFTVATGVRIPLGTPILRKFSARFGGLFFGWAQAIRRSDGFA